MISKERVLSVLRQHKIDVDKIASSPAVFDRACSITYKAIPVPWRWLVGKRRVRRIVDTLRDRVRG